LRRDPEIINRISNICFLHFEEELLTNISSFFLSFFLFFSFFLSEHVNITSFLPGISRICFLCSLTFSVPFFSKLSEVYCYCCCYNTNNNNYNNSIVSNFEKVLKTIWHLRDIHPLLSPISNFLLYDS